MHNTLQYISSYIAVICRTEEKDKKNADNGSATV